MEIPQTLRAALEVEIKGVQQAQIMNDAQAISMRYRTESGKGKRLLTRDTEAVAYAVARMPATFGAVSMALQHALEDSQCYPETLLDVGAGTGAVAWAVDEKLDLKNIICLERESAMRKTGKALMQNGSHVLRNAKWISHDLTIDEIPEKADLVVASYVLNEMSPEDRIKAAKKLWNATNKMLLIIEPGTPVGFSNLKKIREELIKCGANIAAPCVHNNECPKLESDWCHFSCRVGRSSLHRQLKGGEAPYEDEKFMYIAVTREECNCSGARILRHPQVRKGHIMFEVCAKDGVENIKLSKKDGEIYKEAKKLKTGDKLEVK